MKELKNYLMISSLLLLSSCSWFREPEKEIVTVTEIIKNNVPVVERPKGLKLSPVKWYVVTKENYDEFSERFLNAEGNLIFYAISVRSYENLALNMADIKRYIEQQSEIIVYYEEAVTEDISDNVSE
jgi:hypothetical protein